MTKILKLSSAWRETNYRRFHRVPFLRMSGKWLEQAGFHISKTVHVEVQYGKMIITSIDKDQP